MLKIFKLNITWYDGDDYIMLSPVVLAKTAEDACDYFFKTYKFPSKPQISIDEYDVEEGLIV